MILTNSTHKSSKNLLLIIAIGCCGFLLNLVFGPQAQGGAAYQINGFYLGATPAELGVTIEIDPLLDEKYYEVAKDGVHFFFIRIQDKLRVYRIIKEEAANHGDIKSILDNLKLKYGAPNKQQIKTSSMRPKYQMKYITTVKNRAIWKISESQEFIAEIESERVVYELLDHDPEKIKSAKKPKSSESEEFTIENWDPDY